MSQRLSESGGGGGGAAPFDPSKAQQLPPARTTPNIFQRLQLGKPKSRRTLRPASSSMASRSIGEEEEEEKKKQGTTASSSSSGSSTTTTTTNSSSSSSNNNAWVGIGSSGSGMPQRASGSTGATLGHSMSLGMSSSSSTMMGPSPRLSGNSNAVPGHLKMKTRPAPLPPPPPPPPSSSASADEASTYGAGDGDPTPSRPRPSHQAMLGGTVSKLNAHLSPTRRSSRGGEGGGALQASNSGGGGGLETGILSIDLTSDDEAAEDRQQQQQQQRKQQQQSKRSGRGLQQEDVGGSLSSDEDSSASTHQQQHKSGSSSSSNNSTGKSNGRGTAGRRRGLGDILGKLGGGGGGSGGGGSKPQSHHPSTASAAAAAAATAKSYTERKFEELMAAEVVDLNKLREQSWGGIPDRYRGTIWRLLLGYLPANRDRREATLMRKRREYAEILPLYFNIAPEERTMQEQEILRQILVDLPRTQPEMPLFHQEETQRCMERVLYVWAIRHPASGYVQGMNDLITPLILVFLAERLMHPPASSSPSSPSSSSSYSSERPHDSHSTQPSYHSSSISTSSSSSYSSPLSPHSSSASPSSSLSSNPRRSGRTASGAAAAEAQALDVSKVPREILEQVEADVYWCITKLLDNIQDHYTFSQPGLQRMIFRLQALVERHDPSLHRHLEEEGLQYVQFAFRWMNCLLMRELSLDAIIRIWDTELAEETGGFEAFHVYLCAAFLLRFADHLRTLPFQDLVLFLQDLPTHDWTLHEIEPLLSQAHVLRALYPEFGQPGGARVLPPGRGRGGRG